MALLLPRSVFIHIPKTGGTWVRAAVQKAGIPTNEIIAFRESHINTQVIAGSIHAPFSDVEPQSRPSFAFVRHPFTYYQSYWAYKRWFRGWNEVHGVDRLCASDSFSEFVQAVVTHRPGWVSKLYTQYLDHKNEGHGSVTYIGRMESLVDDLVHVLRQFGEQFDEHALRSVPPKNKAAHDERWRDSCQLTPEIMQLIAQSEAVAMQRFGYSTAESSFSVNFAEPERLASQSSL